MGVIDHTNHRLECTCGASESVKILQHGSSYGGSWQAGKAFERFEVTWGAEGVTGPTISSARCSACGATPDVSIS